MQSKLYVLSICQMNWTASPKKEHHKASLLLKVVLTMCALSICARDTLYTSYLRIFTTPQLEGLKFHPFATYDDDDGRSGDIFLST